MPQENEREGEIRYEAPPQLKASERHGPYFLIRDQRRLRITGIYRATSLRWRQVILGIGATGLVLFLASSIPSTIQQRPIVIYLRGLLPVVPGHPVAQVGLLLMMLAIAIWIVLRAIHWRRVTRLEIEAGPEELIIRLESPNAAQQEASRWLSSEIESVIADQYVLIVRPRGGEPVKFALGGPWTGAYWVAEQVRIAMGYPPSPEGPYPTSR
jgi:hypothetical protein